MKRLGILVASDRSHRGERPDASGPAIRAWAPGAGFEVAAEEVVPDEREIIRARLREWADGLRLDLILTSGGTGLGPRDVTPEATLDAVDRRADGIPELLRAETRARTPLAALSRAEAGLRGKTLIVNLPGSPGAVGEWLAVLAPLLHHALAMVDGKGHEEAMKR